MPSQLTIPRTTVTPSTSQAAPLISASLAVPDGDHTVNLSIDRTIANGLNASPASAVLQLDVDQSNDGGQAWTWIGGDQMTGGIYVSPKTGQQENTDFIEVGLNPGTSRLVRGRLFVTGGGGSVAVAGALTTS